MYVSFDAVCLQEHSWLFLMNTPHVLHGQANRFSFNASTYKWPGSAPGALILADLDQDAKEEIIVASPKQKKIYIWEEFRQVKDNPGG